MNLLLRWLVLGLVAYLGLVLLVAVFQRRLLYLPTRVPTSDLAAWAADRQMLAWTNAAGERIGWQRASQLGPAVGAALILHGNAGTAIGREYLADPLQEAWPLDVYILEYPGYADRPGAPSQTALLAAATEAAAQLRGRTNLFLVGESLGTGVASYLAGELGSQVAGVLLMVPFNRMTAVASVHYPWLPVRWLLRDRFPSDEWLARYSGPVAVLLAGADRVVPPALGRKLYEGYGGPKRLWEIPGADHEDVIAQPATWWREVGGFWGLLPASRPAETRHAGPVP